VAVVTGFGSATAIADDGGFAKWILHFCTVTLLAVPDRGRDESSYCTDRPSLIPGLELRDKMRVPPGEPRRGLPERSNWNGRNAGDDRGSCVGDEEGSRVSTKGAPRACGEMAVPWSSRVSKSVAEVCADRG
jgi:hypothetical protein